MRPFVIATATERRTRQLRRIRQETSIRGARGIDEFVPVVINGARQWLRFRGWDAANPILLYLHGGPGGTSLPFRRDIAAWERYFTVVHWEQRGAGKSFSTTLDETSLTLEQLVEDARTVIKHVLWRLDRDRLILLGHSWGSFLGTHLLQKSHDGVAVFVGTGQVGDMAASERLFFDFALDQARKTNDRRALEFLEGIGPYPTATKSDHRHRAKVRGWARHFGWAAGQDREGGRNQAALMATEEYSVRDIFGYLRGTLFVQPLVDVLFDPAFQPIKVATRLPVPFVLLSGAHDSYTATPTAQAYFDVVEAPEKRHVAFDAAGHWPMIDERDAYLDALLEYVRPFVD